VTLLAGRRALVVGAGSGIGRAVAAAFLAEGASVAGIDVVGERVEALAAAGVLAVAGDAADAAGCTGAVGEAIDALGGLDVLVNCVGLFDFRRGLGDLSVAELDAGCDEVFAVNVKSHLLSVHAALGALRASRGGVILTASTSSFLPERGGVLYVASKYALRGVVASLARELAPDVRVNAVAPGATAGTDLRGLRSLGEAERAIGDGPEREADIRDRSPLGVALDGAEVAASYVFLASDAARGMSGRFLHPDGGAQL
jgi:phthalate 3,4-cis-dihydrodiol dehydrogenase